MRAVALLRLAEGMGAPRIAEVLPMTRQAVRNLARRYQQGGLERALYDKQRPGAASLLSVKQRQRIIVNMTIGPKVLLSRQLRGMAKALAGHY